jgi:hypothetical protein
MACFLVTAAAATVTTVFRKKIPEKWHINWFNIMAWGAVIALLVEHIVHNEIVPWPPFFTAMSSSADFHQMLVEMLQIGVPMLIGVTLTWLAMVLIYNRITMPVDKTENSVA